MFKKREKRLEKNKVLFLNYLIKFIFVKHNFRFTTLKIKNFTVNSLLVLKKINFFKKFKNKTLFFSRRFSRFLNMFKICRITPTENNHIQPLARLCKTQLRFLSRSLKKRKFSINSGSVLKLVLEKLNQK
jgi:hypothetical protein